ncbi:MAG TPA: polymer-forming cytoskeletal protein [Terriglobales bacterium]|nr:polymer-forming cytoskeletal protein [Terriglobales bacterium]
MWKRREDEEAEMATGRTPSSPGMSAHGAGESPRATGTIATQIGKSVFIKGELSGSEDLYLDGKVEGSIELRGNNLIVGPNGHVRAGIHARGVIIEGKVDGDIEATDRVELRKTAILVGSVMTQRIAIEDGAYLKGGIDVKRQAAAAPAGAQAVQPQPHPEVKREAVPAAAGGSAQPKPPLVEQKKS